MSKYPVYLFVALIFFGLTKLLQVTVFDSKQYDKNREEANRPIKVLDKKKPANQKKPAVIQELGKAKENNTTESENGNDNQSFESDIKAKEAESPDTFKSGEGSSLSELKNTYLSPIIAKLPEGQLREDVVVRYYKHEKDGKKIYRLKDLGYYIHEKEVTETIGFGSNIIYYGSDVTMEDIQIVGLVLLEEGVAIKSIEPSQFDWKSNSIEIGTDSLLINSPTLSKKQVLSFNKE